MTNQCSLSNLATTTSGRDRSWRTILIHYLEHDIRTLIHPFTNLALHREREPFILERGKGICVCDKNGKPSIEGPAGLWCTALGFGEEALVDAAAEQRRRLRYYRLFGDESQGPAIEPAERLKAMAPMPVSKVFFVNSGSGANDSQVNLMGYYNNATGQPAKKRIISRIKAYHGATLAVASLLVLLAGFS